MPIGELAAGLVQVGECTWVNPDHVAVVEAPRGVGGSVTIRLVSGYQISLTSEESSRADEPFDSAEGPMSDLSDDPELCRLNGELDRSPPQPVCPWPPAWLLALEAEQEEARLRCAARLAAQPPAHPRPEPRQPVQEPPPPPRPHGPRPEPHEWLEAVYSTLLWLGLFGLGVFTGYSLAGEPAPQPCGHLSRVLELERENRSQGIALDQLRRRLLEIETERGEVVQ